MVGKMGSGLGCIDVGKVLEGIRGLAFVGGVEQVDQIGLCLFHQVRIHQLFNIRGTVSLQKGFQILDGEVVLLQQAQHLVCLALDTGYSSGQAQFIEDTVDGSFRYAKILSHFLLGHGLVGMGGVNHVLGFLRKAGDCHGGALV